MAFVKILKFSLILLSFAFILPVQAKVLTPDFTQIKDIKKLKKTFFDYLLPEINQQNKHLSKLRLDIQTGNIETSKLDAIYADYRVKKGDTTSLLTRLDIIPASLVLAQGAYESNWGRSRFAKNYHNFFGIWCFKKGCGVMPLHRNKNAKHEVAKFSSLAENIQRYMQNLNRNAAYKKLRKIRKTKRDKQLHITGLDLSEGLVHYSGIGRQYIKTLHSIITYNKLAKFDQN
jgi:Bax protein